jgi:Flp pilus assembly protein TadG
MTFRRKRDEGGAAAVEFALILPIFLTLVFGMIQFGFYFWTAESANSSARETARRIVVGHCWGASDRDTFAKGHAPRMTGSVTVSPPPVNDMAGDPITVTVKADGNIFSLFPLPANGVITREYDAFMEVDAVADPETCP